jgi:nicotinamidase-related amidase
MGSDDTEARAELLGFALVPRPDRVATLASEQLPAEVRGEAARVQAELATLAADAEMAHPSVGLRQRILASAAKLPRKALLVVDMVCDHLTPGSLLEVPRARAVVPSLAARIERARAEGVPVVYVLDQHEADDPDLDDWGTHNVRGSPGAAVWPGLEPKPGDRIVTKPSYSGFYKSDLLAVLDELKIDALVLTGCLTEIHLQATAMDAMHHGFLVEVPADSQAGTNPELEQGALAVMGTLVPYAPARKERLARLAA